MERQKRLIIIRQQIEYEKPINQLKRLEEWYSKELLKCKKDIKRLNQVNDQYEYDKKRLSQIIISNTHQ